MLNQLMCSFAADEELQRAQIWVKQVVISSNFVDIAIAMVTLQAAAASTEKK